LNPDRPNANEFYDYVSRSTTKPSQAFTHDLSLSIKPRRQVDQWSQPAKFVKP